MMLLIVLLWVLVVEFSMKFHTFVAASIRRIFLQTGITYTIAVSSRIPALPFATFGVSYGPAATNFIDTNNVNMTLFLSPAWPRDNTSDCLLTYGILDVAMTTQNDLGDLKSIHSPIQSF